MMNVDVKILARAASERMRNLLPQLVSRNQIAYMKGREMCEGNRLIDFLIEYNEARDGGFIAAIDFEKAFDSVSHAYIAKVLESYGFPMEFRDLVRTLYHEAESAVMNNGFKTKVFKLGRGCRQGDPLSPYLFSLVLDPLLRKIDEDRDVQGLSTPYRKVKTAAYADDLTLFVKDEASLRRCFQILEDFGQTSGLKVNQTKTEIMPLKGGQVQPDLQVYLKDVIKVTGIYHGNANGRAEANRLNEESALGKMERMMNQ